MIDCSAKEGRSCCSRNVYAILFYLLCALYLLISGTQLRRGLPLILREHPLSDSSSQANMYLFKAYMAIPFLWELRSSIDWTIETTSLSLPAYLKLEDIYAGLTSVRADMEARRHWPRGVRKPSCHKCYTGCLLVTALLVIILGPLLLFSSTSPFSQTNLVKAATVEFGVVFDATATTHADTFGGVFPLGTISRYATQVVQDADPLRTDTFNEYACKASNASLYQPRCGYSYLLGDWSATYQLVQMANASDLTWTINSRALQALQTLLLEAMRKTSGQRCDPDAGGPDATGGVACPVQLQMKVTWERTLAVGSSRTVSLVRTARRPRASS